MASRFRKLPGCEAGRISQAACDSCCRFQFKLGTAPDDRRENSAGPSGLAFAYFLTLIALMARFWQVLEAEIHMATVGMTKSKPAPFFDSNFNFGTTATGRQ